LDAALRTFFQIHTEKPPGDVLIFLPGISQSLDDMTISHPPNMQVKMTLRVWHYQFSGTPVDYLSSAML